MPGFADLPSLNAWLEARCLERWNEIPHGVLPGSVADVQAHERASLMPFRRAFDGFVEQTKRVSPTCLVHFEANRYSVPASFANRPVSVRVYPERLVVVAEGQVVCEHARIVERAHDVPRRTVYDWRHCLAVIQRKPGALRNGAPFAEMPEAFRRLQAQLLQRPGGDREMVDILALVLQHDEQAVLCAVELALEDGVATKTHVLNVLHRLLVWTAPKASMCQSKVVADLRQRRPSVEQVSRIGMDTSKYVFQLHGVNASDQVVLRRKLRRKEMVAFFEKLAPTVIAIEACGASHHWARLLRSFGHEVKLIAPQLVKPYVKRGKNDAADAEALCEAMSRPTMRFVPVKTAEQQAALMLMGLREQLVASRGHVRQHGGN